MAAYLTRRFGIRTRAAEVVLSAGGKQALKGIDLDIPRGSIFGLLGALVYYGRRSGSSLVHGQAMSWAVTMFLFGLIMPGIDNWAHAGGFGGGYLAALALDPRKPERVDHLMAALVCLTLTIASVVASVVLGLKYLQ